MKLICVTNRHLCTREFLEQFESLVQAKPAMIILREKDLSEADYEKLARRCMDRCARCGVLLALHSQLAVAKSLHVTTVQLPLWKLRETPSAATDFAVGVSVHSVEEAVEAEKLHASYLIAGHIFETDCKSGMAGRGLPFLQEVCEAVKIPVYAIGGIVPEQMSELREVGASGACVMSTAMRCEDAKAFVHDFEAYAQ